MTTEERLAKVMDGVHGLPWQTNPCLGSVAIDYATRAANHFEELVRALDNLIREAERLGAETNNKELGPNPIMREARAALDGALKI